MDFKEYVNLAVRTESCDVKVIGGRLEFGNTVRMLHSALGMVTEVVEFFDSLDKQDPINVKEEIGDLFWYIAIAFDAARKEFGTSILMPYDGMIWLGYDIEKTKKELLHYISKFVDMIKRTIYYDKYCMEAKELEKILMTIYKISTWMVGVSGAGKRDDVLELNIEKLRKRYGDKFNEQGALKRNTENELSHYDSSDR